LRCNFATILKVWLSSPIVGVKKYASSATDLETCAELHLHGDQAPSYGINSCRSADRSLNGALRRWQRGRAQIQVAIRATHASALEDSKARSKKKHQQYRYVDRNRAKGMSCDRILLIERHLQLRDLKCGPALCSSIKALTSLIPGLVPVTERFIPKIIERQIAV
jgi:hypothetical protein